MEPKRKSDYLHQASSVLGLLTGIVTALSSVPLPDRLSAPAILVYVTAVCSAFGFIAQKKR